jgi:capsular polysaccharide export protein
VKPNSNTPILWSSSYGIEKNPQIPLFFSQNTVIKKIHSYSKSRVGDVAVGWGSKPNTLAAKRFAAKKNLSYVRLEDGFIGYLGHPSEDKQRLSLIKDDVGIYYDARSPSRLEQLCHDDFTYAEEQRAEYLIAAITHLGISKYNHSRGALPCWLENLPSDCILLVDQTANDQSIESGMANSASFQAMLANAKLAHPTKPIIIKTHPDVLIRARGLGKKTGHFGTDLLPDNVFLLAEDCSISDLMNKVTDVYVVTSQLGFEALLYGKQVHCFGLPFYAGWGLTNDHITCLRRKAGLSLPQLVFASLIQYPTYLHPERQSFCEVEDIVDWLALQLGQRTDVDVCYAFDFSLWKRAFIRQFIGRMAKRVEFVNDAAQLETLLQSSSLDTNCSVLLWGRGRAEWAKTLRQQAEVWFIEDGFLRSVGLGADLRRPSCLVIDKQGMYYDSSEPSDITTILNKTNLAPQQLERATALITRIKQNAVTKYNVGTRQDTDALSSELKRKAEGREIVIVPGQFENDLSIACSLGSIKTNLALLAQVKIDYPSAFIIFKEHPDVYSGVRPGALGEKAALELANLYLAHVDMDSLLNCCDRVCTLTSLTGFEALLRDKQVSVYGSPFYAGWGLTTDKVTLPDRNKQLTLNELVYGAMINYSRYVDWRTGYLTGPEQTVTYLASQRESFANHQLKSSWLARQLRKIHYFVDTLLH